MNLGNAFYGLRVNKSKSNMNISSNDAFDFNASANNPFVIERSSRFYFIFIWAIMILLFGQLGILVVCNYVKTHYVLFILKNILCCLVFISQIICIYLLRNKLAFLSKILMISTPLIFLILLYLFEKRVDYLVYIILTIASTLYLIVYIVKYFISKKSNDLLNGVLSVFYPFSAFFVKTDELQDYLFFNDKHMQLFLIVGLITGFIVSVISIILIKKEIEKKNLIGFFLTIFSVVFIAVWMIPYHSEQNINYAFDKSEGNICTYQIVGMYKRHT